MKRVVQILASMEWADRRREILGVRAYSRLQPDWQLIWGGDADREPDRADGRRAGVIAMIRSPELLERIRRGSVPTVNISGRYVCTDIPQVTPDQFGVGRVAARHLLERGHRRFVFVGNPGEAFSLEREAGFRSEAGGGGGVVR